MNSQFERKHSGKPGKDEWLTPHWIIDAIGPFDTDPCASIERPFDIGQKHNYTYLDNGLMQNWEGRVFCNPPYGKHLAGWLNKCALHKNVIAMIFVRTDTAAFHNYIFPYAHSIMFMSCRMRFINNRGEISSNLAGSPSSLISYDQNNTDVINDAILAKKLRGYIVMLENKNQQ